MVADRAEVGVDGELVPAGVVPGGLVFEVADRAGSVAGRDPREVGEAGRRVRPWLVVRVLGRRLGQALLRSLTRGGRGRCIGGCLPT